VQGINLEVIGDCNDYVGKGLSGGTIIVRPARATEIETEKNTIIGNTVLYGATSGKLFAAGQAGERFAVRNSGATAVVEGCGTNGCEYMTGGAAVFLGDVGDNFAAGMTGGMAFIFDPESKLENLINPNSVTWNKVEVDYWKQYLKNLVQDHAKLTRSKYSQKILYEWDVNINSFIQVCPIEMLDKIEHPVTNKISEKKAS
jgi:glutamate synthase (NADPH/NADH) large chain